MNNKKKIKKPYCQLHVADKTKLDNPFNLT